MPVALPDSPPPAQRSALGNTYVADDITVAPHGRLSD